MTELSHVLLSSAARDCRQSGRCNSDSEDADRKLHETKRITQPRNRSSARNVRREVTVNQNIHLHCSTADHCRSHQSEHPSHTRIAETQHRSISEPGLPETRPLNRVLQEAADKHPIRHSYDPFSRTFDDGAKRV